MCSGGATYPRAVTVQVGAGKIATDGSPRCGGGASRDLRRARPRIGARRLCEDAEDGILSIPGITDRLLQIRRFLALPLLASR
jgi:hypothetical protein